MSTDVLWDSVRSGLISAGTLMVPLGWFDVASVEPFVNNAMIIGGAVISIATFLWMLKVKWGTKAVPEIIADLPHIPTVSPVTGVVQPAIGNPYNADLTKSRPR